MGLDSFTPPSSEVVKQRNLLPFLSLPTCRFYRIDLAREPLDNFVSQGEVIFHLAGLSNLETGWNDPEMTWARQCPAHATSARSGPSVGQPTKPFPVRFQFRRLWTVRLRRRDAADAADLSAGHQ